MYGRPLEPPFAGGRDRCRACLHGLVARPCDPQAAWLGGFCLRHHRDCAAPRLGSDLAISAPRSAAASCARALRSRRAAFPGRQPAGARLPAAGARERRSRWCPRAGCFQDEDQQEQQQDGAERASASQRRCRGGATGSARGAPARSTNEVEAAGPGWLGRRRVVAGVSRMQVAAVRVIAAEPDRDLPRCSPAGSLPPW